MRKLYVTIAVVALSTIGVLALGGVAGAGTDKGSTKVNLLADTFSPDTKSISAGTKVKFNWVTGKHNVIKAKGPGGPIDSGIINSTGIQFKHKFSKTGTYKLICTVHDGMKLKLNVN
ncbi:MAG: Copper binding protein plastocyanin/azurin family [Solirubrobacterales bacterium]|jgi:plastocyanin|nr:Copper binding protein plastocyanin/azurin family [Solirubrobacterales bacterium]